MPHVYICLCIASAWSPNEDTSTSHTPSSEQLAAGNGVVQAVTGDKNNTGMFARQIALDEFQREHQQKEEQIDEQVIAHRAAWCIAIGILLIVVGIFTRRGSFISKRCSYNRQ